MNNILNKICNDKKIAVETQKQKVSAKDLQILINNSEEPRGFKKTIDTNFRNNKISIIALKSKKLVHPKVLFVINLIHLKLQKIYCWKCYLYISFNR